MSEPDNIVLVYLRRIEEKVDRVAADRRDVRVRLRTVWENLAGVHRRLDRVNARVERIERRLVLTEMPH